MKKTTIIATVSFIAIILSLHSLLAEDTDYSYANILATSKSYFSSGINLKDISTIAFGTYKINENNSPSDYAADTYREQSMFCKLMPAMTLNPQTMTVHHVALWQQNATFDMVLRSTNDFVSNSVRLGGWEMDLTNAILEKLAYVSKELGRPAALLDIGGNIGWHSLVSAAAGYPVLTFEPFPENLFMIRWSYCLNPGMRIELYSKGLGVSKDECVIVSHDENRGDGITFCGNITLPDANSGYKFRASISVDRLDSIFGNRFASSSNGQRIGVLKIDVESYEINAFKGGMNFFRSAKIPFIAAEIGMGGADAAVEMLEIFDSLDYQAYVGSTWSTARILSKENFRKYASTLKSQTDIVLTHKDWLKKDVSNYAMWG
ncbi:hypothetical protein HK098_004798 [Nowakowskiella sp. JEL0407]|nr:hypothetical protein HK098_004798 [Nowakowskiella sp. JEL0407]